VGVQIVSSVSAFEEVKLRLLNASHSFIAYAGLLKSYAYVHEAITDHEIAGQLNALHNEIIPLLNIPQGLDIQTYRAKMMERFDNPELPHQLQQIAMDGSQKLVQRIIPSLQQARTLNLPNETLLRCVENWLRFCYQNVPDDPLKDTIEDIKSRSADFNQFKRILTTEIPALLHFELE
jgi:fructuronate reductase